MAHTITLIPGDGTGPEITDAKVRVLDATGVGFEWEKHQGGIRAFERTGNPLPDELLESIRRNGLALKGPLTTLVGEGFPSANVALRKGLNLYGDIVSDLAAGLVGGLGVVPAANDRGVARRLRGSPRHRTRYCWEGDRQSDSSDLFGSTDA